MADNDLMDDDDIQENMASSVDTKKRGAGLIPMLIKWVAIVLVALIFIVTVVVITMNIRDKKGSSHSISPVSEEYRETRDVLQWYQAIGILKVHTADRIPATLIVDVALGYTNNDKSTPQELSATTAELRQEEKIKIEIKHEINDNVLTKNKIKDVRFTQYDIVEQ